MALTIRAANMMPAAICETGGRRSPLRNTTSAVKPWSIGFSEYEPLPGMHVNGELTQGENIADMGGVKLVYAALQKALDKNPATREQKIDGFTPEQRFFLGFAQVWRSVQRDEDLKLQVNTNPHSPARYRVNGPLSDLVEFQKAFNLPDNCLSRTSTGQEGEYLVSELDL